MISGNNKFKLTLEFDIWPYQIQIERRRPTISWCSSHNNKEKQNTKVGKIGIDFWIEKSSLPLC
jgi:hypothetical protein